MYCKELDVFSWMRTIAKKFVTKETTNKSVTATSKLKRTGLIVDNIIIIGVSPSDA